MRVNRPVLGAGILGLGIGYFAWYTPYAALTKALSAGLLPGMDESVGGLVLLPAAALGTLIGSVLFLGLSSWWRYAGLGRFHIMSRVAKTGDPRVDRRCPGSPHPAQCAAASPTTSGSRSPRAAWARSCC